MRLDPLATNIALVGLVAASAALLATRRKALRRWALCLGTLATLDLIANLAGLGAFFWWSPLHILSTAFLGVDEILETHGVIKTTAGYILDLVFWSAVIALTMKVWRWRKSRGAPSEESGGSPSSG